MRRRTRDLRLRLLARRRARVISKQTARRRSSASDALRRGLPVRAVCGFDVGSWPSIGDAGHRPPLVDLVEPFLDDLERQEVLRCSRRMKRSRSTSAGIELAVPRRRALGIDQPLTLEEADLRDRDVGELVAQLVRARRRSTTCARLATSAFPLRRRARSSAGTGRSAPRRRGAAALRRRARGSRTCRSANRRRGAGSRRRRGRCTTWRRDTVMSSRKMSESGCRPIVGGVAASSRYDEPAFGSVAHDEQPDPGGQTVEVALRARLPRRRPRPPAGSASCPRRRRRAARRTTSRTGHPAGSDVHSGRRARGQGIGGHRAHNGPSTSTSA